MRVSVCVCVCVCVFVLKWGWGGGLYFLEYELSRFFKLLFLGGGGGVGWSNTSGESKA